MYLISKIHLNTGIKILIRKIIKKIISILLKYRLLFENFLYINFFKPQELYFSKRIITHYGADYHWHNEKSQNINIKNGNLGYGLFIYALLRNIRPSYVLCFGSMYGFIPHMLAAACRDNFKGTVDFVDPSYDIDETCNHNYGQGFWRKIDVKNHFSYFNTNKYIKYYQKTSFEFAKIARKKYDLIYFDGDHSYKGAKKDFDNFWPKLNDDGYIFFHDINIVKPDPLQHGMKFEFWKLIKEISNRPDVQMITIPSKVSGLGIIQKKKIET